jgi:DNA-binding transcriptional MerR regulator
MKSYSAADAGRILRVKAHVIRYWEKMIPLIQPVKDKQGKRFYSGRDIELLFRLKHLLYDRRFTIEGAKEELYREVSDEQQDLRAQIAVLRSQLMDLYLQVKS